MDLSIVIASFKKEFIIIETLEALIRILNANELKFEIVLVVDGNIDRTFEKVNGSAFPQVRVFKLDKNQGKGFALRFGVDKLINMGQFVAFLDADLDIGPEALINAIKFLDKNSKVDCVIGSKFHKESELKYSRRRIIISRFYSSFVKGLFNLNISETQTGLKLFRFACIKSVIENTFSNRFSFDLELMLQIYKNNYKVCEIPVKLNHTGESTIKMYHFLETFFGTLMVYYRFIILKGRR